MHSPIEVPVALGRRSYSIYIGKGMVKEAGKRIAGLGKNHVFVLTDENVAPFYLSLLEESLKSASLRYGRILLPPGEQTKSFSQLEEVVRQLLAQGIERDSLLIALGGGVIGDLTGFAASILLRGIDFVQIPTSLLAQVDSSVGGKTGIDLPEGKNLVGSFHQPRLVLIDLDTFGTLPKRERLAGYAEIVKYGLIDDPAFFHWLEENGMRVLDGETQALSQAIAHSCRNKARIVASDEKESGPRALLNLGHTFAHAMEAEMGFNSQLIHGEAVALGLHLAFRWSVETGLCPHADLERLVRHFKEVGLPLWPQDVKLALPVQAWIGHMKKDKKVKNGEIRFVLTRGIGKAFTGAKVNLQEMEKFLMGMGAFSL